MIWFLSSLDRYNWHFIRIKNMILYLKSAGVNWKIGKNEVHMYSTMVLIWQYKQSLPRLESDDSDTLLQF